MWSARTLTLVAVIPGNAKRDLNNFQYILIYVSNQMQRYTVYFIWKLLYMFRVVPPPIIRSAYNCVYSVWY